MAERRINILAGCTHTSVCTVDCRGRFPDESACCVPSRRRTHRLRNPNPL